MSAAAVALLAACGDSTGSSNQLELVAPDANVRTHEVATAVVRGAILTESSYEGTLGDVAVSAGRMDDSTIAMLVPAVPAGEHRLRLAIGGKTAEAMLMVAVTPNVADPAAYIGAIDSVLADRVAGAHAALVASNAGSVAVDGPGFEQDITLAQAVLDSARAAFASMTPADRQEVANILYATLEADYAVGSVLNRELIASSAPAYCSEEGRVRTAEENYACKRALQQDLALLQQEATYCKSTVLNAARTRTIIRTFLRQIADGCHLIRLTHWAVSTWEAMQWPTMPEFDPDAWVEEIFAPSIAPSMSAAVATQAAPLVFSWGVPRTFAPVMMFRPMIAADVGRVPAATQLNTLLNAMVEGWHEANEESGGRLSRGPATLDRVTSAPFHPLPFSRSRIHMGAVIPQAIRWQGTWTNAGLQLTFDADNRSADIPFTFDVVYNGDEFGSDTIRVSAVLTMDSTAVYQAAALGWWTNTRLSDGQSYQVDVRPNGKGVYVLPLPATGYCSGMYYTRVGNTCEYGASWRVRSAAGRYYVEIFGFWNGYYGEASPSTMPLTSHSLILDGQATMRFTKNP